MSEHRPNGGAEVSTSAPPVVLIRCRENGPLVIQGPFRLVDHLGNAYPLPTDKPVIALCRCGQSASKPFCDGSHKGSGFQGGPLAPDPGSGTSEAGNEAAGT